jgi:hypothetical protein
MFSFLKRSRKPSSARRKANSFRPTFEALEDRQMMASGLGASLSAGVLTIQDNQAGDLIHIRQLGGEVSVDGIAIRTGGTSQSYVSASAVGLIDVQTLAGNDQVWAGDIGNPLTLPVMSQGLVVGDTLFSSASPNGIVQTSNVKTAAIAAGGQVISLFTDGSLYRADGAANGKGTRLASTGVSAFALDGQGDLFIDWNGWLGRANAATCTGANACWTTLANSGVSAFALDGQGDLFIDWNGWLGRANAATCTGANACWTTLANSGVSAFALDGQGDLFIDWNGWLGRANAATCTGANACWTTLANSGVSAFALDGQGDLFIDWNGWLGRANAATCTGANACWTTVSNNVVQAADGSIWFLGTATVDSAGDHAIYRLTNGQVTPMPGVASQLSVSGGTVSELNAAGGTSAISLGNGLSLSLQNGNLYVITPQGQSLLALPNVQGLSSVGGQVTVQVGAVLRATLSAQADPASGAVTLRLTNVQVNLGSLGGIVNGLVSNLQSVLAPLSPLFQPLTNSPAFNFLFQQNNANGPLTLADILTSPTAQAVLSAYPDIQAQAASLTSVINAVRPVWNFLHSLPALPGGMYTLGGVSITLPVGGAPTITGLTGDLLNGLGATFLQTEDPTGAARAALAQTAADLSGAGVTLPDAATTLQALLTGNIGQNLFSYSLSPLAVTLNTPPITLGMFTYAGVVTVDGTMDFGVTLSAGATVNLTTASLFGGNPLAGLSVSGEVTANLHIDLNGGVWILGATGAHLCGYKLDGQSGITMTATLDGTGVHLSSPGWTNTVIPTWEGPNLQDLPQTLQTIQGMVLLTAVEGDKALVQALEQTPIGGTVAWVSGTLASLDPSGNPVVQDVRNALNPANLSF